MAALAGQYANPLAGAHVTPERIDQGVDYAGTGTYTALARGVITEISPGGWGSYGNYIKYQITDKASPLYGQQIYYAEGVNPVPGLHVGQVVNPGDPIVNLIPGWHSGTEIGFAGKGADSTYARESGGGYSEGHPTVAGEEFSALLGRLGAPQGKIENTPTAGSGPLPFSAAKGLTGTVTDTVGGIASSIGGAVSTGADVVSALSDFVSNPVPALLTIVLVIAGAVMVYEGAGRMLGFGSPTKSTVKAASLGLAAA